MNRAVFSYSVRTAWKLWLSFACIVMVLILSLAWFFPTLATNASYGDMLEGMPDQLKQALGVVGDQSTYFGFISVNYFNSLHIYIFSAFVIVLAHRLVSRPIDDTSLSYFLSGTLSRVSYLLTRIVFFMVAIVLLSGVTLFVTVAGQYSFDSGSEVMWRDILIQNTVVTVLFMFWGACAVVVRMLSNSGAVSLAVTSTVIVAQYFLNLLSSLSEELEWLRYTTVFALLDAELYADHAWRVGLVVGAFILAIAALSALALYLFRRKDLYL